MKDRNETTKAIVANELPLRAADMEARHQAQRQLGLAAYRGLMITNGGAIVALFTFVGNNPQIFDSHRVWWGFSLFVAGIALVLAATLLAYFAEGYYSEDQFQQVWWAYATLHDLDPQVYDDKCRRARRIGDIFHRSSLGCAVCSLLSFVGGAAFVLGGVLAR
jgi:hypothetical protein